MKENDELVPSMSSRYVHDNGVLASLVRHNSDYKRSIIELIENSEDAGADCIEIDISGKKSNAHTIRVNRIKIVDNGCGMSHIDTVLLCLSAYHNDTDSHADAGTSKFNGVGIKALHSHFGRQTIRTTTHCDIPTKKEVYDRFDAKNNAKIKGIIDNEFKVMKHYSELQAGGPDSEVRTYQTMTKDLARTNIVSFENETEEDISFTEVTFDKPIKDKSLDLTEGDIVRMVKHRFRYLTNGGIICVRCNQLWKGVKEIDTSFVEDRPVSSMFFTMKVDGKVYEKGSCTITYLDPKTNNMVELDPIELCRYTPKNDNRAISKPMTKAQLKKLPDVFGDIVGFEKKLVGTTGTPVGDIVESISGSNIGDNWTNSQIATQRGVDLITDAKAGSPLSLAPRMNGIFCVDDPRFKQELKENRSKLAQDTEVVRLYTMWRNQLVKFFGKVYKDNYGYDSSEKSEKQAKEIEQELSPKIKGMLAGISSKRSNNTNARKNTPDEKKVLNRIWKCNECEKTFKVSRDLTPEYCGHHAVSSAYQGCKSKDIEPHKFSFKKLEVSPSPVDGFCPVFVDADGSKNLTIKVWSNHPLFLAEQMHGKKHDIKIDKAVVANEAIKYFIGMYSLACAKEKIAKAGEDSFSDISNTMEASIRTMTMRSYKELKDTKRRSANDYLRKHHKINLQTLMNEELGCIKELGCKYSLGDLSKLVKQEKERNSLMDDEEIDEVVV